MDEESRHTRHTVLLGDIGLSVDVNVNYLEAGRLDPAPDQVSLSGTTRTNVAPNAITKDFIFGGFTGFAGGLHFPSGQQGLSG